ncbi:MAG: hypothetical protein ACREAA_11305 [Candidatus Polarisedimenticolia bacterium]
MLTHRFGRAATLTALVLAAVLSTGCPSTKWVNSWAQEPVAVAPMKKILVIGMAKEEANRRTFEDTLVKALEGAGVSAVASYTVMGDEKVNEENLRAKVKEGGFDGVTLTRLVSKETRVTSVPPSMYTAPGYGWGPYYGYSSWSTVYSPGYLISETVVRLESQAWHAGDKGTLVWSGVSETVEPKSVPAICSALSTLLVKDLKKHKLI